ncbi:MAG: hypothetical protein J6H31_02900 [Butyrivibrio sp.]|nr:hypothetical protein [Butyrivibrio sp.]
MFFPEKVLRYFHNRLKWYNSLLKAKSTETIPDVFNTEGKKCIALIPHADDELLGMGTLLSKDKSIKLIYFEFLGSDYSEENKTTRQNEFKSFCSKLGIEFDYFGEAAKNAIKNADMVLLPSLIDWHDEHRKLNYILRDVLESSDSNPKIAWYNISVYNSSDMHAEYVFESKNELRKKYELFVTTYISQKRIPVLRFKVKERLYGRHVGEYAAEKFFVFEYSTWLNLIDEFQKHDLNPDMEKMKKSIDSFDLIDAISKRVYEEIMK